MSGTILHVAPFDASRYPPLIHTVRVCAAAGIESVIVASRPIPSPEVLGGARIVAPAQLAGGGSQQIHLIQHTRAIARRERPRLVIAHNTRGLVAAAVAVPLLGAPLVYHCHDFDGIDGSGARDAVFRTCERLAGARVAEMWVPARERIGIARQRRLRPPVVLVRNCPRTLADLPEKGRLRAWLAAQGARGGGQGRIITRHGMIGHVHYIRETIEALPLLPEDVLFAIIGDGDRDAIASYRETAARLGLADRVFFHPFVPHSMLSSLLVDGDVGMGVYVPSDLNAMTPAPNKVFENMALGIPVVVAQGNSVADDVTRAGAGLAVPVGSREALAGALGELLAPGPFSEACRQRSREAHLTTFNYESQLRATRLGALLAGHLTPQSHRR